MSKVKFNIVEETAVYAKVKVEYEIDIYIGEISDLKDMEIDYKNLPPETVLDRIDQTDDETLLDELWNNLKPENVIMEDS